jgi:hypothetical protein
VAGTTSIVYVDGDTHREMSCGCCGGILECSFGCESEGVQQGELG